MYIVFYTPNIYYYFLVRTVIPSNQEVTYTIPKKTETIVPKKLTPEEREDLNKKIDEASRSVSTYDIKASLKNVEWYSYITDVKSTTLSSGSAIDIYIDPPEQWSAKQALRNASNNTVEIFEKAFANEKVIEVQIYVKGNLIDNYGKETKQDVMRFKMIRDTANKITWSNFKQNVDIDYNNLINILDDYYIHKAVR